jgi:hypothetical protein
MSVLRVASIGLLMLVGCALDSEPSSTQVEQHIPGGVLFCEAWGCGMNSPEIDHLGVHDIHGVVGGLPNANGFRVTKIVKAGLLYKQIWSVKSSLVVTGTPGTLINSGVSGTVVTITNGSSTYEIQIGKLIRVPMWAHVTGGEMTNTYEIQWDIVAAGGGDQKRVWKNICKKPPVDGSNDLLGMNRFQSVVFENDWIDADRKTVSTRPEKFWWNIGCAGHALAKLHLTGHTAGAQAEHGFHSDERMRQTTLKMITADYCGTGFAFTVAGQKLGWTDQFAWNEYSVGFVGKKEAEWTEKGVSCLNTPRVDANPTPIGSATFLTLEDSIKEECGYWRPDYCKDADITNLNGTHMISANP